MVFRKLPTPIVRPKQNHLHPLQQPPAPQHLLPIATTSTSLSPSLSLPTTQTHLSKLTHLVKTHLQPTFTPQDLLTFYKKHLHHHPSLTHLDFHLFSYAASLDCFRHDHSTLEWMAHSLAASHRLDSLVQLLQFIASNPCPCSDGIFSCSRTEPIFRMSIQSFCRAGKLSEALQAFDVMKRLIDGKASVEFYNIILHGFIKRGRFDEAVEFYGRMSRERVRVDVVTFNTMISGYCRNGKFDLALELFREMKDKGCVPNVVSFNTLVKGFFREGKVEEAVEMAYEMIEMGCEISCVTSEILVEGLCRKARVMDACDLLIDFSEKGVLPRGFDCFGLVEILCEKGEVLRAMELVDELWKQGHSPSLVACTTMIEGLRRIRKIGEAAVFMEMMLKNGIVPDIVTFNCLLEDMCDVSRVLEANILRLLASSKGLDLDGITYRILVSGYSREGRRKEGEALVDEMLDREFLPDIATYNKLMDGLAKSASTISR